MRRVIPAATEDGWLVGREWVGTGETGAAVGTSVRFYRRPVTAARVRSRSGVRAPSPRATLARSAPLNIQSSADTPTHDPLQRASVPAGAGTPAAGRESSCRSPASRPVQHAIQPPYAGGRRVQGDMQIRGEEGLSTLVCRTPRTPPERASIAAPSAHIRVGLSHNQVGAVRMVALRRRARATTVYAASGTP